jgi:hypothetical protein
MAQHHPPFLWWTQLTFGLVWYLQGDERAAHCHGGHRYEVGEGCASPGRRGSDLLRECVCVSTACGTLFSNGTVRIITADTARAMRACGVYVEWHDITHLFCGGRVRLACVHSVTIMRLHWEWSMCAVNRQRSASLRRGVF